MGTIGLNRLDGSALQPVIKVGDVNTALLLRLFDLGSDAFDPLVNPTPIPLDISAATSMVMRFVKPGATPDADPVVVDKTATFATVVGLPGFVGDGTDGYVEYRTEADFLDRAGLWRREARITLPTGFVSSEIVDFVVVATL